MNNVKHAILIAILALVLVTGCKTKTDEGKVDSASEPKATEQQDMATKEQNIFPKFKAKDFDGNEVDETIFSKNKINIVNFWFTGCKPCVEEMPDIQALKEKHKDDGVNVIGVCADAADEKYLETAKEIMKKANADFTQLAIKDEKDNDEMIKFMQQIMAFPTTYVVDDQGNILAGPILGAINEGKNKDQIDSIINDHLNNK